MLLLALVRCGAHGVSRFAATVYRPAPLQPAQARTRPVLSVVTVVHGHDPAALARGLESWLAAGVHEIIVLIGADDEPCQRVIEHYPVTVIRSRQDLRSDLRAGWRAASADLVALAEPGTIWARDVAVRVAAAFGPGVGAVAVRRNVYAAHGLLNRYTDMNLDAQAFGSAAAGSVLGRAVTGGWGATAVFRRQVLLEVEDQFGDSDPGPPGERLAELVLRQGLAVVFQRSARVWPDQPSSAPAVLADSARQGYRAAVRRRPDGVPGARRPYRAAVRCAAVLAGPAALVSLGYAVAVARAGAWGALLGLAVWVLLTRAALLLPHLCRRPSSVLALPLHVLLQGVLDVVRFGGLLAGLTASAAVILRRIRPGAADPSDRDSAPGVAGAAAAHELVVIDPALRLQPIRPRAAQVRASVEPARLVVAPRPIPAGDSAELLDDELLDDERIDLCAGRAPEPAQRR